MANTGTDEAFDFWAARQHLGEQAGEADVITVGAKDVEIMTGYLAHCNLAGCGWEGSQWQPDKAQANLERQAHIADHRAALDRVRAANAGILAEAETATADAVPGG
jgi:hypothetical protein